ncbi:MAG: hypothetical protein OEV62_03760 [Actinomycetota bacterium]|nr:hypothetical protein [Actinomycetota bacterium]MDH5278719.1 hypothetical protein [Actinomycetota bacterium]
MRGRLGTAARSALVALALGPVLGVLWWLLAPTIPFDVLDGAVYSAPNTPGDWFGVDGWFLVVGGFLGLVVGVVVFVRRGAHPISAALGMTAGCLLAAGVGWWVGRVLGPAPLDDQLAAVAAGQQVMRPLQLLAPSVLLAPAVAALASFGALVASAPVALRPPAATPVSPAATPTP